MPFAFADFKANKFYRRLFLQNDLIREKMALAMDALYIKVMDYENEWEVKIEYDMYCHLHENNAYLWLPVIYVPSQRILIMPNLGQSLDHSIPCLSDDESLKEFSESLISCISEIHRAGWCHSNINPSNIMWAYDFKLQAVLIGVGNSARCGDLQGKNVNMDPNYTPRNAGLRKKCSDDWESLLYVLEYALIGSPLPWASCISEEERQNLKEEWIQSNSSELAHRIAADRSEQLSWLKKIYFLIQTDSFDDDDCKFNNTFEEIERKPYLIEQEQIEKAMAKQRNDLGTCAELPLMSYIQSALERYQISLTNVKMGQIFQAKNDSASEQALIDSGSQVNAQLSLIDILIESKRYFDLKKVLVAKSRSMEINASAIASIDNSLHIDAADIEELPLFNETKMFQFSENDLGEIELRDMSTQNDDDLDAIQALIPNGHQNGLFLVEFYCKQQYFEFQRCNQSKLKIIPEKVSEKIKRVEEKLIMKFFQLEKDLLYFRKADIFACGLYNAKISART